MKSRKTVLSFLVGSIAATLLAIAFIACSDDPFFGPPLIPTPTLLFVADSFGGSKSISVFDINADGNTAPLRTIAGAATNLDAPIGLYAFNGELFVTNFQAPSITVYPITATDNQFSTRMISGGSTGLVSPFGIFVTNSEIFVADPGVGVLVFPITADGNVAPSRTITSLMTPFGVAVDNGLLYVADRIDEAISVFDVNADGAATPVRKITGAATGLFNPNGIAIHGNELFVGNFAGGADILAFNKTADGNAAPLRVISGPSTGLIHTVALAIRGSDIFVGNEVLNPTGAAVRVFRTNDDGNVAPTRTLTGASTGLSNTPEGVAIF